MYADYFLKFIDEAAATAVLMDGEVPKYANIDTLGPIEGYEGWHVNVRVVLGQEDGEPLVPFCVYPVVPRRVWAGPMYPVAPPVPPPESPVAEEPVAEEA
jgi:hypothetical protein